MTQTNFKAVIFDMDGVLVDSEPLHQKAFESLFAELGKTHDHGIVYANYYGTSDRKLLEDFIRINKLSHELQDLLARKQKFLLRYLREHRPVFKELHQLIPELEKRYALAVASSSPHLVIDVVMEISALRPHFKAIVGFDDVTHAKPDPELYLVAANRLGIPTSQCIVVEDAAHGVQAAKAAGMTVIGFTTSLSAETLKRAKADFIAKDYAEIRAILLGA